MELTARGLAVRVRSAYAQAAGRSQVLVAPSAGELPACARRPAPFPLQTRIPAVSARIAPPWLSSPSRASCLISRMPGIPWGGPIYSITGGPFLSIEISPSTLPPWSAWVPRWGVLVAKGFADDRLSQLELAQVAPGTAL